MKFLTLLKKELKELLTFQTIATMAAMLLILVVMGEFMGGAIEEATDSESGTVAICDNDQTDFTADLIEQIRLSGYTVDLKEITTDDKAELLDESDTDYLIVIPKGFTSSIVEEKKAAEIEYISRVASVSVTNSVQSLDSTTAVSIIQNAVCSTLLTAEYGVPVEELEFIYSPVGVKEVTVVTDKSADVNSSQIASYVMSQSMLIPLVVFVLVIMASQMIVNAIATEKLDKTLETLLSAPVTRISVLGAKMTAAAIVALLNAVVYMLGFGKYMESVTSLESNLGLDSESSANFIEQLGLSLSVGEYLLLGIQLFLSILIALSISLILGALVNDAKQTQTIILPVMILTMIPYMMSLFIDINTVEPAILKYIAWAIPFTHTFTAMNNLIFENMTVFWAGMIYQIIFLVICMFFAVKLFTSDKIFTISLNFGQKKKAKKNLSKEN